MRHDTIPRGLNGHINQDGIGGNAPLGIKVWAPGHEGARDKKTEI